MENKNIDLSFNVEDTNKVIQKIRDMTLREIAFKSNPPGLIMRFGHLSSEEDVSLVVTPTIIIQGVGFSTTVHSGIQVAVSDVEKDKDLIKKEETNGK